MNVLDEVAIQVAVLSQNCDMAISVGMYRTGRDGQGPLAGDE